MIRGKTNSFLFLFLLMSLAGFTQEVDLNKKITVIAKSVTLAELLHHIGEQGSLHFSYSHDQINTAQTVSFVARKKTLAQIFEKLTKDCHVQCLIVENQVVVKPLRNVTPSEAADKNRSAQYTISGTIRDAETGETMIGTTVHVHGTTTGIVTNGYGYYALTLPAGSYNMVYSFIGYESQIIPVELQQNKKIDLKLAFNTEALNVVEVTGEKKEEEITQSQVGQVKVKSKTMNQLPGFLGEVEILKAIQTIPGIKSHGDGSAYFYVRGGYRDQNMILIDEAPIFNPAHLMGFFTSITPNAIKDFTLCKGNIPASYGGNLSSLIDIKTKEGNMNRMSGHGSVGLLTNKFTLEGPITKDKHSFFMATRWSHLVYLLPRSVIADKEKLIFGFSDFNLKMNFRLNQHNRLYASCYAGKDEYSYPLTQTDTTVSTADSVQHYKYGIAWQNFTGSIRWNHLFHDKLFSNITLFTSSYNYYLFANKGIWTSFIGNGGLKADMTWYRKPVNTIRFGALINNHFFTPGVFNSSIDQQTYIIPSSTQYQTSSLSLYISSEQKINDKFSAHYGCRLPMWHNIGPGKYYLYNDIYKLYDSIISTDASTFNSYVNLEPRLSLHYTINSLSAVTASYTRTVQHLQVLSNSISPFTTLEIWMPAGPNIKPQKADQWSAGYNRHLKKRTLLWITEGFYRNMHNQIDYKDHANMLLNEHLEGELRYGKTWVYGLETQLRKDDGKLTGWLSYSYCRVLRKTDDVNNGNVYPAFWDQPHNFTTSVIYRHSTRLKFSAMWFLLSGSPITTPIGFMMYQGNQVPVYGDKHNDRLPPYHRMDISASYRLNKTTTRRYQHDVSMSVFNLYARKNPIQINFNKTVTADGIRVPQDFYAPPALESTMIYLLGIMPSLSYEFTF